jgi:phage/plasmid-associated DNA primase
LRSVDEAIRRRFHLIPFAVTIPPEERDPDLKLKLEAEWPGIMAWLVRGCLSWQASGLQPPKAVQDATAAYLEAEDALAAWIEERCEVDPQAWCSSSALFASWSQWADAASETVGSQKKLTQKLESRGFTIKNTKHARGMQGIRVITDEPFTPPWIWSGDACDATLDNRRHARAHERGIAKLASHPSPGRREGTDRSPVDPLASPATDAVGKRPAGTRSAAKLNLGHGSRVVIAVSVWTNARGQQRPRTAAIAISAVISSTEATAVEVAAACETAVEPAVATVEPAVATAVTAHRCAGGRRRSSA